MSGFRQSITLKRRTGTGSFTKGIFTDSGTSDITIQGSIQPLKADEMELLPEGRRDSEAFRIYTDTKLFPANDDTKLNADRVVLGGKEYEVLACATWQNNVINHYKAVVVKL